MDYLEEYKKWMESNFIDEETKNELKSIANDEKEIEERFYKSLEFGTGGLRGIIGAGTNRMNKYTVSKATQGLANFIIKENGQDRGVAISYDSRNMSKEFSEIAANSLNTYAFIPFAFKHNAASSANSGDIRLESYAIAIPLSAPPCFKM